MFNAVYDCEVVGENSCYTWRDRAQEGVEGKGTAVMSVKAFFDWLESAARESDHPEGLWKETGMILSVCQLPYLIFT